MKIESITKYRAEKRRREAMANFDRATLRWTWLLPSGNLLELCDDDLLFLERMPMNYRNALHRACGPIHITRTDIKMAEPYYDPSEIRLGQPHVVEHALRYGDIRRAIPQRLYISPRGRRAGQTMVVMQVDVRWSNTQREERWSFKEFAEHYRREIVELDAIKNA